MYGGEYRDQQFWEMVVIAATAAGRKTEYEAAKYADELLARRNERFPASKREN